ncbi:MAG: PAS domain-containing protein [Pseudomonadales bacterium]|nr:PAS domain-containing protein [Pseudomonadales bacterium]
MKFNDCDKCNILDAIPLAILLTNIEGNFVFCNKKSGKILGYTFQELQSMNIEQLIPPSLK